MFDGVPEQFHQFIASSRTSLPLPLSFSLHGSSAQATFPTFDHPFPSQLQPHSLLHPQLHHHPSPPTHKDEVLQPEGSTPDPTTDPWSNDEVLALLRIRSSMENWFPDFTWEHVSRKLADLGFKRSAEKCKEKFEEESRHFNSNISYTKNYRFFTELEELCHGENPQVLPQKNPNAETLPTSEVDHARQISLDKDSRKEKKLRNSKRKRNRKFEMLKGFCEEIVSKMMAQQEEFHGKIIEEMVKRDEEKVAREEAWKKQEMERTTKEMETRAHEQAIAGDRQTKLIEFLKILTSNVSFETQSSERRKNHKASDDSFSSTSHSSFQHQNPNPISLTSNQTQLEATKNPNSTSSAQDNLITNNTQNLSSLAPALSAQVRPQNPNLGQNERDDIGKRWPRDEVMALINLRCSIPNSNNGGPHDQDKEGLTKGPLWERISLGMLEMGYKRSAKRCKEKWENINKYFRKIKGVNKKRSLGSRTCPYFHQLSSLYSQGPPLVAPDGQENHLDMPENHSVMPENQLRSPQGGSRDGNMNVDEAGNDSIQVAGVDFEF